VPLARQTQHSSICMLWEGGRIQVQPCCNAAMELVSTLSASLKASQLQVVAACRTSCCSSGHQLQHCMPSSCLPGISPHATTPVLSNKTNFHNQYHAARPCTRLRPIPSLCSKTFWVTEHICLYVLVLI